MEISIISKTGKAIIMKSLIEPVFIRIQIIQKFLQGILRISKRFTMFHETLHLVG